MPESRPITRPTSSTSPGPRPAGSRAWHFGSSSLNLRPSPGRRRRGRSGARSRGTPRRAPRGSRRLVLARAEAERAERRGDLAPASPPMIAAGEPHDALAGSPAGSPSRARSRAARAAPPGCTRMFPGCGSAWKKPCTRICSQKISSSRRATSRRIDAHARAAPRRRSRARRARTRSPGRARVECARTTGGTKTSVTAREVLGHALGVRRLVHEVELERHVASATSSMSTRKSKFGLEPGEHARPGRRSCGCRCATMRCDLRVLDLDRDLAAVVQPCRGAPARATPRRSAPGRAARTPPRRAAAAPAGARLEQSTSGRGGTRSWRRESTSTYSSGRMSAREPRNWQTLIGSPSSRVASR